MSSLRLPAPAKLNLFLHVVGRRGDGYHQLQSVFQLIDLCDIITLASRNDDRITRVGGVPGLAADDDLVVRSARMLAAHVDGGVPGVDITVEKRIPVGAGLGGGSSDAASTLLGLNQLWGLGLSINALAKLALPLGADVPFFVRGHNAWVEGIGEQITPVGLHTAWFAVCVPSVHVPTAAVFGAPELTRQHPITTIRAAFFGGHVQQLVAAGSNNCEPVARQRYPDVEAVFDALHGFPARLSGTGGAVFVACDNQQQAQTVADAASPVAQCFVCRGLQRSPALRCRAGARSADG
ncbi:4-(cytidine 5'-diphospho)-2-C-methyl-D-erythritol kinase [bacterium]|nr:4-(cytidine 5'-diphospho)-2-C-methyl-D-erythritol kinase [bacterium]